MQRDPRTPELAPTSPPSLLSTKRRPARMPRILLWLPICCALGIQSAGAGEDFDEETTNLLVEAVEAATANDFYNARCRGDISGRRTDNLNKLIVGKLRITVLSVQDDLFPERGYRRVQKRLEAQNTEALRNIGGCQGAKDAELPEKLRALYEAKMEAIRALP